MFSSRLPTSTHDGTRVGPVSSLASPGGADGGRGASGRFWRGGSDMIGNRLPWKLSAMPGTNVGLPTDDGGLATGMVFGGVGTLIVAGKFGSTGVLSASGPFGTGRVVWPVFHAVPG